MYSKSLIALTLVLITAIAFLSLGCDQTHRTIDTPKADGLKLNDLDYFETCGLNVMVFSNWYDVNFFDDSKLSGVEIIHHEVRTATNGDIRLNPTPEQWDPKPEFVERKVNKQNNSIEASLTYPDYDFNYTIKAEAHNGGILLSVNLEKPLPQALVGRAGLNLEFLPSAYFEKAYLMDSVGGAFPLYPSGPMTVDKAGTTEPDPIAKGKTLVLAPEDPARRVTIKAKDYDLLLFDGRNKAQNGWFVVRTLVPKAKTGKVIEWFLTANTIPNWTRPPVIAHSQLGYHPSQNKVAVIELDKNDTPLPSARLLKITETGESIEIYKAPTKNWGKFLRYNYSTFDFTPVKETGLYAIEYGSVRTKPFRIAPDIYENAWHPTLDVYLPVQMDHMFVNEAYKVWHGAAHLDDALQAPVNHKHFDLYSQGPTTDSPYKPGEHIPGLNVGGWFDAGDFDIRTPSHYNVVSNLAHTWESFRLKRDETAIDQKIRFVDIHHPDGIPDLLQQIEHGTLALIAQHRAVGHAINGIIVSDLSQYTHLGDGVTMTDNLIYNPELQPHESDGFTSGTPDDRWAFTSKSTPLNYGSIAALAAASRALRGYNDPLADECLETAKKVWDEEHAHEPNLFSFGNTTGGQMEAEELSAAVELLICTKNAKYAERVNQLIPDINDERFSFRAPVAIRAIPYMDKSYSEKLESLARNYKKQLDKFYEQNPFGVPISTRGWAGSGLVIYSAITNYYLHKAFPDIIGPEYTLSGLNYIYGCHPASDISFVSAVGTHSKKIAYGNNRADYSFIAGGIVPGVLIIKPDFPENKEDWPFLWAENEYTIGNAAAYIFLVNAANDLLNGN
ncbi:MAG: glycoside hydrolase family 9 protein [Phycisphaerae bacterium]|nr:glycoside hydrolase family 9 protein [Phycisphaerae bacterium]MDD5381813.1 glycoside hydrolase family 9 protein [Phycisphaerae bacterium]